MAEKRPTLPLLLTAQDLRAGNAVYWTGTGWSPRIEDGLVAEGETTAAALEAVRDDRGQLAQVLDLFLFSVRPDADGVKPTHFRERARLIGPSFPNDFGRTPRGADRVSL